MCRFLLISVFLALVAVIHSGPVAKFNYGGNRVSELSCTEMTVEVFDLKEKLDLDGKSYVPDNLEFNKEVLAAINQTKADRPSKYLVKLLVKMTGGSPRNLLLMSVEMMPKKYTEMAYKNMVENLPVDRRPTKKCIPPAQKIRKLMAVCINEMSDETIEKVLYGN